jgi:hypothetical protein
VAETKTLANKVGLTRGKTILVGILSVVLVVILYVQFGKSGEKSGAEPAGYRPPRAIVAIQPATSSAANTVTLAAAKGPTTNDNNDAAAPIIDATRWKSPQVSSVMAYDPFALPAAFPQPTLSGGNKAKDGQALLAEAAAAEAKRLADEVEKLHMELEELRQRGVHVIVREGDQYAAVIGDRMLHVGDKINEFTVMAIDLDGVHVERKESP